MNVNKSSTCKLDHVHVLSKKKIQNKRDIENMDKIHRVILNILPRRATFFLWGACSKHLITLCHEDFKCQLS